jgi:hypothetical protein
MIGSEFVQPTARDFLHLYVISVLAKLNSNITITKGLPQVS